ncbi:MAG: pyridoxal phosphate-dependent aminotransferase family protein [Pedobacter sp.]|nr:MAG: pyridoxal phosphate-dependent aminotransferase family protein [Pedobacter sp.]
MRDEFRHLDVPLSSSIVLNNKRYLYFGGTAYLGIPQNKDFLELYLQGLSKFGLNNGTSRANNVQLGIYNDAEAFAASYFGAEDCLITSSGYLAAQLVLKELSSLGELRYAPASHPALWLDGAPNVNLGFDTWAADLVAEINESAKQNWVIVSNSLNNLYPEVYDFSFLKDIEITKNITLIVDDSHGIGVVGSGKGVFSGLPTQNNIERLVLASMAKALGVDAGLIIGSRHLISKLKQTQEFLGASPPAAAGLFAFMNASSIYRTEHSKLVDLTQHLGLHLASHDAWTFDPEFPVFLSTKEGLADRLFNRDILISSFAYPDKNGGVIDRIVLSSWHSLLDIEELVLALSD